MKVILVIDVPNEYKDKDLVIVGDSLWLGYEEGHCIEEIEDLETDVLNLKELPHRQIEKRYDMFSEYDQYYIDEWSIGWNDCLREIIGGENVCK